MHNRPPKSAIVQNVRLLRNVRPPPAAVQLCSPTGSQAASGPQKHILYNCFPGGGGGPTPPPPLPPLTGAPPQGALARALWRRA